MAITIKTHKMLWGRAASRCAMCRTELALDSTETDDESLIGDACHIVARSESGPRGDVPIEVTQRDTYSNLILLCKNHHKQVDDQRNYYTVEKLREIKAKHEAWVREGLGTFDAQQQRNDEIYAAYIEEWERRAHVSEWPQWTSSLLAARPSIIYGVVEELKLLPRWLLSRVWPKRYTELEAAFVNFRLVLSDLLRVFFEHAETKDGRYVTVQLYRGVDGWNKHYDVDLLRYEYHVDLVHDLTFELTRSANYVCDRVRQNLSPSYRIDTGHLLVSRGDIRGYVNYCPEYEGSERTIRPYPGLEQFKSIRMKRDFYVGSGQEPQQGSADLT